MGAKEGGGDTPSSSSSLLLVDLPLLYDDDRVAKLVSDTPAGRARPAPRAYRAKKRSSWVIRGTAVNSRAHQIYLTTRDILACQFAVGLGQSKSKIESPGRWITGDYRLGTYTQSSKVCLFLLRNKVSLKENRGAKKEKDYKLR